MEPEAYRRKARQLHPDRLAVGGCRACTAEMHAGLGQNWRLWQNWLEETQASVDSRILWLQGIIVIEFQRS